MKIKSWHANSIAERIAIKAFEHILKPINAQCEALALQHYNEIIDGHFSNVFNRDLAIKDGLLPRIRQCYVFYGKEDDFSDIRAGYYSPELEPNIVVLRAETDEDNNLIGDGLMCYRLYVRSSTRRRHMKNALEQRNNVLKQRKAMQDAIYMRLVDKTTDKVVKEWPEIAEFVYDVLPDARPNALANSYPKPFAEFLAGFLNPALEMSKDTKIVITKGE